MASKIISHLQEVIQLSEAEQQEFLGILKKQNVSKKTFLVKPGQPVNEEYFVLKGCLLAYYLDEFGNKHILQFAVEDWWISDFKAFFKQEPAELYIEALENCELLVLQKNHLDTLYQRIPQFERFFRIKTTKAFVSLRSRVLSTLQKTAKERYIEFCETYPAIEKRIPNYHIANYLGVKPESLSRIRKELGQLNKV